MGVYDSRMGNVSKVSDEGLSKFYEKWLKEMEYRKEYNKRRNEWKKSLLEEVRKRGLDMEMGESESRESELKKERDWNNGKVKD